MSVPEKYADRFGTVYDISGSDGKIVITYFDVDNRDDVINRITMTIPQNMNMNEKLPNIYGTVLRNSMAVRVDH